MAEELSKRPIEETIELIIQILEENEDKQYFKKLKNNFIKQYEIYTNKKNAAQINKRIQKHKQELKKGLSEENKKLMTQTFRNISRALKLQEKSKNEKLEEIKNYFINTLGQQERLFKDYIDLKRQQLETVNIQTEILEPYSKANKTIEKLQSWITKKIYNNKEGIQVIYTSTNFKTGDLPQFYFWSSEIFQDKLKAEYSKGEASLRYRASESFIKKHQQQLKKSKVEFLNPNLSKMIQKNGKEISVLQYLQQIHQSIVNIASFQKGGAISFSSGNKNYNITNLGDYWEGFAYWFFSASEQEIQQLIQTATENNIEQGIYLFIKNGAYQVDNQHGFFSADIQNIYAVKSYGASAMRLENLYQFYKNLPSLLKDKQQLKVILKEKFFDNSKRNKIEHFISETGQFVAEEELKKITNLT